jgi:hypothetical protein
MTDMHLDDCPNVISSAWNKNAKFCLSTSGLGRIYLVLIVNGSRMMDTLNGLYVLFSLLLFPLIITAYVVAGDVLGFHLLVCCMSTMHILVI